MIRNEKQLRVAERKRRELVEALEADAERLAVMPPAAARVALRGAESIIRQLEREISDYQDLADFPPSVIRYRGLRHLSQALIQARIASGLTQAELASLVGIHENQIQKYERTDYEQASLTRLQEIAAAMPVLGAFELQPNVEPRPYRNWSTLSDRVFEVARSTAPKSESFKWDELDVRRPA